MNSQPDRFATVHEHRSEAHDSAHPSSAQLPQPGSPEYWAELRKSGHVCATCKTRVWPAPAPEAHPEPIGAIVSQLPHQTARLPHNGPLPIVDESPAELIRNAATLLALLGSAERREDGTRIVRFGAGAVLEMRHLLARAVVKLESDVALNRHVEVAVSITDAGRKALARSESDRGPIALARHEARRGDRGPSRCRP